ncbi:MAG: ABC transporter substrate-binding protein [Solirubrobacteraceae bacterium]|nr:ABC transporter substrate-binding protein [Solirubrobacteraceae bacterium]
MRPRANIRFLLALALAAALALVVAACGGDDTKDSGSAAPTAAATEPAASDVKLPEKTKATLVLDFLPNAVHAGIYRAVAAGYYADNNIELRIIQPTSTADTLKLIDAGKADFGIADGIDVAGQIDAGRGATAIMAVTQRPLGGIITRKEDGITDPNQLEGQQVGITGVPSDTAILDTIVENAGGDPAKVKKVTIGFNGVQNLENGKVKGFVGFYPADGVQVEQDGTPTNTFKFDEHGGPRYPGLVVFSTEDKIASDAPLMKAFVDATVRGYDDVLADPQQGLTDLLAENKTLKKGITQAQLDAYMPLFKADAPGYGVIESAEIAKLSEFLVAAKLIKQPIAPERFGTNELLPSQ